MKIKMLVPLRLKLASDFAPTLPVLLHALNFMEKKLMKAYEYILILQPTSPLRTFTDIDKSIKKLKKQKS